jgi:hypothetical protein
MKLSVKLLSIYIVIALLAAPLVGYLTYRGVKGKTISAIKEDIYAQMDQVDEVLTQFLKSIEHDLDTLANDKRAIIRNDDNFTNFLNADEKNFMYTIGPEEQAIIDLGESLLISDAIHARIKDKFKTRFINEVELKGKADNVKLYTIV